MKLTKKKLRGNKVSHAKNRLARIFNPNNQSLKVWHNGKLIRIAMSTSMIQRLKKDGRVGEYRLYKYAKVEKKEKMQKPEDVKKIVETEMAKVRKTTKSIKSSKKSQETMDISSIVGKK